MTSCSVYKNVSVLSLYLYQTVRPHTQERCDIHRCDRDKLEPVIHCQLTSETSDWRFSGTDWTCSICSCSTRVPSCYKTITVCRPPICTSNPNTCHLIFIEVFVIFSVSIPFRISSHLPFPFIIRLRQSLSPLCPWLSRFTATHNGSLTPPNLPFLISSYKLSEN